MVIKRKAPIVTGVKKRCKRECTPITSIPYVIKQPGLYLFTEHMTTNIASGNAITIASDDVIVDLNGFMLDGLAAGSGTEAKGIYADHCKNVMIKNGVIKGFKNAINIDSSWRASGDNSLPPKPSNAIIIENIRALKNIYKGIYVKGDNSIIRNNMISGGGIGIHVSGSDFDGVASGQGTVIENNSISSLYETNVFGIYLVYTSKIAVKNNVISGLRSSPGGGQSACISLQNTQDILIVDNQMLESSVGIIIQYDSGGGSFATVCKYMNTVTTAVPTLIKNDPGYTVVALGINN